jgi:hypothetical protein
MMGCRDSSGFHGYCLSPQVILPFTVQRVFRHLLGLVLAKLVATMQSCPLQIASLAVVLPPPPHDLRSVLVPHIKYTYSSAARSWPITTRQRQRFSHWTVASFIVSFASSVSFHLNHLSSSSFPRQQEELQSQQSTIRRP